MDEHLPIESEDVIDYRRVFAMEISRTKRDYVTYFRQHIKTLKEYYLNEIIVFIHNASVSITTKSSMPI